MFGSNKHYQWSFEINDINLFPVLKIPSSFNFIFSLVGKPHATPSSGMGYTVLAHLMCGSEFVFKVRSYGDGATA